MQTKKGGRDGRDNRGIRGAVVSSSAAISHTGCGGEAGEAELQVDRARRCGHRHRSQLINGKFELFGITTDDVVAALAPKLGALAVPVNGDHVQQIDGTSDHVGVVDR